jgi:2-methylisocitrate lyase-like PEP mutase family enzyme
MGNPEIQQQQAQAAQFRQWHQQPPILVLPNAWDAASARLFAQVGARAIATTSSGVAAVLGYPDGERMGRDEMVAAIARIVAAVEGACPVSADIETGYGDTVEAKIATIHAVVETGVVGINIEDSARHSAADAASSPLVDLAEQTTLIQTIRAAASEWGIPLVINARTDLYLYATDDEQHRLAETVRRGNAYLESGADCVFPIGASDAATIGDLARAIHGPINILAGPQTPSVLELAGLGVARVSVGGGLTRVALGAARRAAQELLEQGTFTTMAQQALPSADFRRLFAG